MLVHHSSLEGWLAAFNFYELEYLEHNYDPFSLNFILLAFVSSQSIFLGFLDERMNGNRVFTLNGLVLCGQALVEACSCHISRSLLHWDKIFGLINYNFWQANCTYFFYVTKTFQNMKLVTWIFCLILCYIMTSSLVFSWHFGY